ncbi:protein translocase subunit SecD [bacterium]|nr:protein translocase subunit SecD [bacterium]
MDKTKTKISLALIIVLAFFVLNFSFPQYINRGIDWFNSKINLGLPHFPDVPFKLGLDLKGGAHLVYQADLSKIDAKERAETMQGLRDIIERRVNIFGVTEPVITVEQAQKAYRLVVDLPGVKDVSKAIEMIGKTPYLEFREERPKEETSKILSSQKALEDKIAKEKEDSKNLSLSDSERALLSEDPYFKPTKLTGKYLKKAKVDFNQTSLEPEVLLEFNSEGAEIFKEITSKNVGKRIAIYIDNNLISAPVVREAITMGKAQITGNFTLKEAKELARNLNAGALPVPISLISQETVGPTLGVISLQKSLKAGIFGFLAVILFMIAYYRLSGLLASFSLIIYAAILLSLFKLIPVTLTLAGIGGAILSVGMAVDANVLIFERMKEELKQGENFERAVAIGFSRAWSAIRDSNFTTLLVALIMFSFGTSFVKGFALTLSLGIFVSLFSALFVTRVFLDSFRGKNISRKTRIWV